MPDVIWDMDARQAMTGVPCFRCCTSARKKRARSVTGGNLAPGCGR